MVTVLLLSTSESTNVIRKNNISGIKIVVHCCHGKSFRRFNRNKPKQQEEFSAALCQRVFLTKLFKINSFFFIKCINRMSVKHYFSVTVIPVIFTQSRVHAECFCSRSFGSLQTFYRFHFMSERELGSVHTER